ncbi:MAG TPA: thioesterase family protein [Candidatus Acidoferrum sp.]|nr:thioesterase family protein [Candidatus Acidoferrum sp.]
MKSESSSDGRHTKHAASERSFAEAQVRVRYAETDQMGVVYHGNYFTWFEIGRVELCRQLGFEYKKMESEDDSFIVVAEAYCRYKRPARFDDLLTVRTRVVESLRRTIRFGYELLNETTGEIIATGETVHVICDRQGRPKALPEKYRKYFPAGGADHDGASKKAGTQHHS